MRGVLFGVTLIAALPVAALADEAALTGIWSGTVPEISGPGRCKPWYYADALINVKADGTGTVEFRSHGTGSAGAPIMIDIQARSDRTYSGTYTEFDGTRDVFGRLERAEASFTYHNPHGCSYGGTLNKAD